MGNYILNRYYLRGAFSSTFPFSYNSTLGTAKIVDFNPLSIIIGTVFGASAGRVSQFAGEGTMGELLASPFNLAGTGTDEGTKPK